MKSNLFVFATMLTISAFNYASEPVGSSFFPADIREYCIAAKTGPCEDLAALLKAAQERVQETGAFNWLEGEQEKCIELSDLIKKEMEEAQQKASQDAAHSSEAKTEDVDKQ